MQGCCIAVLDYINWQLSVYNVLKSRLLTIQNCPPGCFNCVAHAQVKVISNTLYTVGQLNL